MTTKYYPHQLLEGKILNNGWRVVRRLVRPDSATGAFFSCGYLVENDEGTPGYLKAFDFFSRLKIHDNPNWTQELENSLKEFNCEEKLLRICKRLSRVVNAIDAGDVNITEKESPNNVRYIIFELADGDIRNQIASAEKLDIPWVLRALHQLSVGLQQLHSVGAAHQDFKPSNALLFDGFKSAKLGDLGRAARKGAESPNDEREIAGEIGYAPPELRYGALPASWEARRFGCDLYLLGSMISSLFTDVPITPLIMMTLDERFHPEYWRGSYTEVLPFIRQAFYEAIEYVSDEFPPEFKDDLTINLKQLCDPDPLLRGHPIDRSMLWGNQYSLQRFVSSFDRLALRAEISLLRN